MNAHRLPSTLVVTLGALLISGIYFAGLRGLADTAAIPARHAITQWTQARTLPGPREWREVRAALRTARGFEPDNPLFVEELGRLYEMRTRGLDSTLPVVRAFLARALDDFRTAARMRPASPTTWANIALAKYRLGELDAAFTAAAERAAQLGRWEPGVQRVLSEIGVNAWAALSPPNRATAAAAAERGLEMQPRAIERVLAAGVDRARFCADVSASAPRTALACARLK